MNTPDVGPLPPAPAGAAKAADRPRMPLGGLKAERLSDRLAEALHRAIEDGQWPTGTRLPTEAALATQYGVSRTVVREAVSRLRSTGLLVARQGSGVYVAAPEAVRPLLFDPAVRHDLASVLEIVEVRRALESESAAMAALRASPAQRQAIQVALARVDASVASGSAGIDDDLAFHQTIAEASGNAQFPKLLRHLEQYLREAMAVTRSNESLKPDFMDQVRREHLAIAQAIAAGDAEAARAAAAHHMQQAALRLQDADAPIQRLRPAGPPPKAS